jgi:glycosyltransferase involved in cell wall biosynthesis
MDEIAVTILMPAHNAAKYIGDAIRSVLEQSFTNFELLIVNDGSKDNTEAMVRSFTDKRIVLLNQLHGGVSHALNNGLSVAKGKYIARFDADDICLSHRLEKQFNFLEANPDYVIVGSDAEYMLENGDHLFNFTCIGHTHHELIQKLYFYCPFIHSSVMYRKQVVLKAGGYSILAHNFEDYFLWTQLAKSGKLYNLREKLIRIRFNPDSVTIDEKWRGRRFRELKRNCITRGSISIEESNELLAIIQQQDTGKIKESSYYALCAKKFLTDNYQPRKARAYAGKAINSMPLRWDNYALMLAAFFPGKWIQWLHKRSPNKL